MRSKPFRSTSASKQASMVPQRWSWEPPSTAPTEDQRGGGRKHTLSVRAHNNNNNNTDWMFADEFSQQL